MAKKRRSRDRSKSSQPNPRPLAPEHRAPLAPASDVPSLPTGFDPDASRQRVVESLRNTDGPPHLVGFEAVGIQELIAANGRPLAMKGASTLVREFDRANLERSRPAGTGGPIFAGGGRGMLVVPASLVGDTVAELQARYHDITWGGQLAIATVALDVNDEAASMRWLRLLLDGAKDMAPPPMVPVPPTHDKRCADCFARFAETTYPGPEGPVSTCWRCAAAVTQGRQASDYNWTLEELQTQGVVAVVSADGNNLGALFAGLGSLEDAALCSDLVAAIFRHAHEHACPSDGRFVDPVVGGDDIRVFLPPERLIDYVTRLSLRLKQLCDALAGSSVPPRLVDAVQQLGVGVGAVIAPFHFPASRLLAMAHDFEDSAKAACIAKGHRSALDWLWVRSGEELSQGLHVLSSSGSHPKAHSLEPAHWAHYLDKARALGRMTSSQRSLLIQRDASPDDDDERANRYRYQVARHPYWRRWFEACGVEWRNPSELAANLPDARMVDAAELLAMPPGGPTA